MPNLRDILNKIKWTEDLRNVEIQYIHRGAFHDMKSVVGNEIREIGRSFLMTTDAAIPYHRITKIVYNGRVVFEREKLEKKR